MDMVAIEEKTFGEMKQRFEVFIKQVQTLCGDKREKEEWLTNNDICQLCIYHSVPCNLTGTTELCLIPKSDANAITRHRIFSSL
jgi:hypothetical protein